LGAVGQQLLGFVEHVGVDQRRVGRVVVGAAKLDRLPMGSGLPAPRRQLGRCRDRVAGLLVLLYAQRATRITRLTTKDVIVTKTGVQMLLGEQPLVVPAALGELIMELLNEHRDAIATG
jgi:hypothetical protein